MGDPSTRTNPDGGGSVLALLAGAVLGAAGLGWWFHPIP